jgi:hypothetical protein
MDSRKSNEQVDIIPCSVGFLPRLDVSSRRVPTVFLILQQDKDIDKYYHKTTFDAQAVVAAAAA